MKNKMTCGIRKVVGVLALVALPLTAFPLVAAAQPHGPGMMGGAGHGPAMHGRDGHGLTGSWRASLTEDQKSEISLSHLRMSRQHALLEARIQAREAEIRNLVTSDEGAEQSLETAIDELMALEKEKVLGHYRHMIEVRQLLTPQQRVSFDMDVISGKHGHKGGHEGDRRGAGSHGGGHR